MSTDSQQAQSDVKSTIIWTGAAIVIVAVIAVIANVL